MKRLTAFLLITGLAIFPVACSSLLSAGSASDSGAAHGLPGGPPGLPPGARPALAAASLARARGECSLAGPSSGTKAVTKGPMALSTAVAFARYQPGSPSVTVQEATVLGAVKGKFPYLPVGLMGPAGVENDGEPVLLVEETGVDHLSRSPDGKVRHWHRYKVLFDQRTGLQLAETWW